MKKESIFPRIQKKLSNFIHDEEGTVLRSKAAIVGPLAVGAVILMSKEMAIEAQAVTRHNCHSSHASHYSGGDHVSHSSHTSGYGTIDNNGSTPAHSSHSSAGASGFSHTAGTFGAEERSAENN